MRTETVDLYGYFGLDRGEAAGGQLTCQMLEPIEQVNPNRTFPAVLILPGGAYRWTSKRESEPIALRFLARGYSAFVLDYSCAPSRFPTALREGAMAMRYLREHGGALGIDTGKIAAIGFSAGGHLCATLGTLYDSAEVQAVSGEINIRPDALILSYPVAVSHGRTHEESFRNLCGDDLVLREKLSLERLVRPDMPPVFLWHTRTDESVPVRNSLLLAVALEEAGVPFTMHVYGEGKHGLSTGDSVVFPSRDLPPVSGDLREWPDKAIDFLCQLGIQIEDRGNTDE